MPNDGITHTGACLTEAFPPTRAACPRSYPSAWITKPLPPWTGSCPRTPRGALSLSPRALAPT
mgnify:CR=1 FL=1